MYGSLLPVVEACVVVAVPGRVGEVRVAADFVLINHRFRVSRKIPESSWRKVRSIRFADRNVKFLTVKRADGQYALPWQSSRLSDRLARRSE